MSGYDIEAQRASVRRTDLRLRADHPHVRTEIYELPPYVHVIFVPREQLDLTGLGKAFADRYVRLTQQTQIVNERPSRGERIAGIADPDIGEEVEGLTFSRPEVETLLAGCFPGLPLMTGMGDERGGRMRISFAEALDADLEGALRPFLKTLLRGREFDLDVRPESDEVPRSTGSQNDVIASIERSRIQPARKRPSVPSFVKEDEDWWFASLPALFRGELRRELTPFVADAGSACYLQAGGSPGIDLRQALLTYDTIYMQPPSEEEFGDLGETRPVARDDLLELVAADRVRLLHTGPEERADPGFLEEARRENPNGVIGRRRSAALFVSDLVETADEYVLGKPEHASAMLEIIGRMSDETGTPPTETSRLLLGPQHALRSCLQPLIDRGLLSYDVVGAEFSSAYERLSRKALSGEAGYFGSGIHIAHVLDATLLPAWRGEREFVEGWIPPMRLMGDRLNFYRSANDRIAASWVANERRREERRVILPPVPVFEMRADVAISDILRFTSVDRRKGRALITRLSEMPESMRRTEIERLTSELSGFEAGRATAKKRILALDTAVSLGTWYLGINMFPVVPMFTVLNKVLDRARTVPALEVFLDEIERTFGKSLGRNEDISFLSKVSRVAEFRTDPN